MINLRTIIIKKKLVHRILSRINLKLFVTLICLVFIGNSIYLNFDSLSNQKITFLEILWLFGGILLTTLSIIINGYAWKLLVNNICFTGSSDKLDTLKLFISTNIYKYLPGGIWHFVSRYNALCFKFSYEKSVQSVLLEPLLMLVSGLVYIPFGGSNIFLLILCWSSPLIFLPECRNYIVNKLKAIKANIFSENIKLKDINLEHKTQNISTKLIYPYKPLFVEILFVLFRFLGFLCCLNAFSIGALTPSGILISSFSTAWIVGLVVPAAPGGLGVFESVVLFSIGSQLPEAPLLASLLCYRLVSTISDLFAALIYPIKNYLIS